MQTLSLNETWTLAFTHPETGEKHTIPATVPGNVELDLERAGLLHDALKPDNEHCARWIDFTDWCYEMVFDFSALPPKAKKAVLKFDGIDTTATVFLNDEKLLDCNNMFLAYSIDVTTKLRVGSNQLRVEISAPEIAARKFVPPPFHFTQREPSAYLRKARHMWGWDNAPRRLSAGIWRKVTLEFLPEIRFETVYTYTEFLRPETNSAELGCHYSFSTPDRDLSNYRLCIRLEREGVCAIDGIYPIMHSYGHLNAGKLIVSNPALWFPVGYGEPNLYDFTLELQKAGAVVARHTHRLGIRRIRLERTETTTPEGAGEFQFYCNDEKIYIRGTNWKPLSPYHSQTPTRLRRALELALECNCNLIRVWGGGIYEDTEFFDFCDEHGLLVWQDFMFACEFPPQEEFFLRAVEQEAEQIVTKYRNHASLALWCGDNENDMAFYWGNMIERNLLPSHNQVSRKILPYVVRNLDPARDYLESSPFVADAAMTRRYEEQPQDALLYFAPEQHIYCSGQLPPGGFREFFRQSAAHFCSETGPIRICAMSESPEIITGELSRISHLWHLDPDSVPLEHDLIHQSARYCALWCHTTSSLLKTTFGRSFSPEQPEELVAAVNFYVADLFKFAIES